MGKEVFICDSLVFILWVGCAAPNPLEERLTTAHTGYYTLSPLKLLSHYKKPDMQQDKEKRKIINAEARLEKKRESHDLQG